MSSDPSGDASSYFYAFASGDLTMSQTISGLSAGATYRFETYIASIASGSPDALVAELQWQDGGGTDIGTPVSLLNSSAPSDAWQQVEQTGLVAPTNTAQAVLSVTFDDRGGADAFADIFTDEFFFEETAAPPTNSDPVFASGASTSLTVDEDDPATSLSALLEVDDSDTGQTLEWSVASGPTNGTLSGFPATASSGTGVQPAGVTYEPNTDFAGSDSFEIQVDDGNGGTDNITVNVTVNNLAPVFTSAATASFAENATGTVLDNDATNGGAGTADSGVTYSISGTDASAFTIDAATGALSFNTAPDHEAPADSDANNEYLVDVTADDGEASNNTTVQSVTITVTNVDETPVFTATGPFSIGETAAGGTTIGDVDATDGDGGATDANLTYSITAGNLDLDSDANEAFAIDGATGVITVNDPDDLDHEAVTSASLTVQASDGSFSPTTTVDISILDAAEAPVATTNAASGVTSTEATLNGTVGTGGGPDATITFEYYVTDDGPGTATTVAATPGTVTAASGEAVTADLTGLAVDTEYTFEVISTTDEGTTRGGALTFTTAGAPELDVFAATTGPRSAVANGGTYDIGTTDIGTTITVTVTFENNGSANATIGSFSPSGNLSDFTVTSAPSSGTIAPGGSEQGTVEFTPTTTGVRSWTLSTRTNDSDEDPYIFTLEGTGDPIPPTATTDPASGISATAATLNGTINPGGASTTVEFSYYETSAGSGSATTVTAAESPVTGTTGQAVTAPLTGLTPGVEYTFSVSASNSEGSDAGTDLTFTTGAQAPTATITAPAAGDISGTTVDLSGTVNPNGASTTVDFQLTPDGGTAFTVPAAESPLTGNTDQSVTATATGLTQGTSYTVEIIATNSEGSFTSGDESFTTNLEVVVSGTDGTGNDTGYRMLAPPTAATQADLEDDLDFGVSSGALLYTYDGVQWNAGTSSTALDRGRGFILYFFDDATDPVTSTGITLDLPSSEENQEDDVTVSGLANADRFQVLGNPFDVEFDLAGLAGGDLAAAGFQSSIQVWNPNNAAYDFITQGDAGDNVATWQGFVVERTTVGSGAESVTYAASGRLSGSGSLIGSNALIGPIAVAPSATEDASKSEKDSHDYATITIEADLSANGTSSVPLRDRSVIRFDSRAASGWDAYDLSDLPPPNPTTYLTTSLPGQRSGQPVQRAQASEPLPSGGLAGDIESEMPLAIQSIGAGGSVTLAWPSDARSTVPEEWAVELVDTQENVRVNLRTDTYTFTMGADAHAAGSEPLGSRFRIEVRGGAALPVNLAQFTAVPNGRNVDLAWRTLGEQNNEGFAIERALASDANEALTWTRIGFVGGAGTTTDAKSYAFLDDDLPASAMDVRYRLRQVDVDGAFTYSDEKAVRLAAPDRMALTAPNPNPVRGQAKMDFAVPSTKTVRVDVYDLLGRRVTTLLDRTVSAPGGTLTVNTSDWAPGLYFVRMTADGFSSTQRLTVIR